MSHPKLGRTPGGRAVFDLVVELTHAFHRLRAAGAKFGAVTPWGGSTLGLLQTLKMEGPHTVPQIARMRPVARQHIQKLANELAAQGLVEFVENPAHKRSKLVRLTEKGERVYAELSEQAGALAEALAQGMDEAEVRAAADVLRTLRKKLS
jgi:DNA-binding MarR family transcriptional regulator